MASTEQRSLFDLVNARVPRKDVNKLGSAIVNGPTLVDEWEGKRLAGQLGRVFEYMKDGQWRTLSQITLVCAPGTEAAMSARLRDIRNKQGHTVNRRRVGNPKDGAYEYQVILKQ